MLTDVIMLKTAPLDSVLVKQVKQNKLSTNFNPTPLLVTGTKVSMVTVQRPDGSSMMRNSSKFWHLPSTINVYPDDIILEPKKEEGLIVPPVVQEEPPVIPEETPVTSEEKPPLKRSMRQSKRPANIKDYV